MLFYVKFSVLLTVLFVINQTYSADFRDCGSDFEVDSFEIEGCEVAVCPLTPGSNTTLKLSVIEIPPLNTITSQAVLRLFGNDFKIDITPNPCELLNCPVRQSTNFTYYATVHINDTFHLPVDGTLRITADYENTLYAVSKTAFCVEADISIKL